MEMRESERLARWLLYNKALPESVLTPLWYESRGDDADLGQLLIQSGHLNDKQLDHFRQQAEQAWQSRTTPDQATEKQITEKQITEKQSDKREKNEGNSSNRLTVRLDVPIRLLPRNSSNSLIRSAAPDQKRPRINKGARSRTTQKLDSLLSIAAKSGNSESEPESRPSKPAAEIKTSEEPGPPARESSQSNGEEAIQKQVGRLGDYLVHDEISRGGMGLVFRAFYKPDDIEVALKLMLGKNPPSEHIERFERESQSLKMLNHPNIVKLYDHGMVEERPYFAMELVRGIPLNNYVKDYVKLHGQVPDFSWSCRMISKIGRALLVCHEQGIIHRDVKPENILIEMDPDKGEERPVLVDFGLAKHDRASFDANDPNAPATLTKTGEVLGTPKYMAPEQLEKGCHFGDIGPHTDVWGLAATLYFCLSAQAPHERASLVNIYKALMTHNPGAILALNPEVPPWLDSLCSQALIREGDDRISLLDFLEQLERPDQLLGIKKALLRAFMTLSFVLVVLSGAVVWWALKDRQAPRLRLKAVPSMVNETTLLVEGQVLDESPELVIVRVGKKIKRAKVLESGHFKVTLKLLNNRNNIKFMALDSAGNKSKKIEKVILFDSQKPTLKIDRLPIRTFNDILTVTGTVNESDCTIQSQQSITKSVDQKFSIDLPIKPGLNKLILNATDSAGNQSINAPVKIIRDLIVTVGLKGRYPTIAKALHSVGHYTRIQLLPGSHFVKNSTIKNRIEIVGNIKDPKLYRVIAKQGACFTLTAAECHLSGFAMSTERSTQELPNPQLVKVSSGLAVIDNCDFQSVEGGAIGVISLSKDNQSRLIIKSSTISRCTMAAISIQGPAAYLEVNDLKVTDNEEKGLWIFGRAKVKITRSIFDRNNQGICTEDNGDVEINDCSISNNRSHGLAFNGAGVNSTISLHKCRIIRNGLGRAGHGLTAEAVRISMHECELIGNGGNGIKLEGQCDLFIENSTNRANGRYGILARHSKARYRNIDFGLGSRNRHFKALNGGTVKAVAKK
jgi:serine/threonine protein kinase